MAMSVAEAHAPLPVIVGMLPRSVRAARIGVKSHEEKNVSLCFRVNTSVVNTKDVRDA
jgi:hypothetical protein